MAKYISQLPSGLAKFTFTDEDGDVFAAFRLNMTDPRTADRLQKFQQELTSMQEPDGDADVSAFVAFEYTIEEKFCEFLGYDCKEELFGVLAATSILEDGRFFCILQPFLDGFGEVFGVESLSTIMAEYGGNIISDLYQGITDGWETIQQWLTDLPGKFKSAFNEVTSWVSTTFTGAWEAAWGGLQTGVVNAVNGVIGVINDMLQTVADGVNKLFSMLNFSIDMPDIFGGGTVGFEMPTVSAPQIPYLATGAVIPPNAPFYAVLGDQRHGNNIEAPEDLIRKIVREEAGNAGSDRIENLLETLISVVRSIRIGDDDIGQAAQRYIRSSERSMGGY